MAERTPTLGRQLRHYRASRGYTVRKAAARAGVPAIRLSQWERGLRMPSVESLTKLAVAYNVLIDELCRGLRSKAVKELHARLSQEINSDKPP